MLRTRFCARPHCTRTSALSVDLSSVCSEISWTARKAGEPDVQDLFQTPPVASHHIAMQGSLTSSIFELRASNTKLQTQLNVLQLQLAETE